MRIKTIRIENFRSFEHETIDLNAYNCFVGPNGAGKSTVLAALNVFFQERASSSTAPIPGPSRSASSCGMIFCIPDKVFIWPYINLSISRYENFQLVGIEMKEKSTVLITDLGVYTNTGILLETILFHVQLRRAYE